MMHRARGLLLWTFPSHQHEQFQIFVYEQRFFVVEKWWLSAIWEIFCEIIAMEFTTLQFHNFFLLENRKCEDRFDDRINRLHNTTEKLQETWSFSLRKVLKITEYVICSVPSQNVECWFTTSIIMSGSPIDIVMTSFQPEMCSNCRLWFFVLTKLQSNCS